MPSPNFNTATTALLLTLATAIFAPTPAQAANTPPSDLREGHSSVAVGYPFLSFDHSIDDTWAIGAAGAVYWLPLGPTLDGGARVTYHAFQGEQFAASATLGAGFFDIPGSSGGQPPSDLEVRAAWLLPQIELAVGLKPFSETPNLILRCGAGPLLVSAFKRPPSVDSLGLPSVIASGELMVRAVPGFEFGVGFPDLVGVRLTW